MTFKTVHGSQVSRPLSVEYVGNKIFVRKNIRRVEITSDMPDQNPVEMWEYEEAYGHISEYAEYITAQNEIELTDLEIQQIMDEQAITDLEIAVAELGG